MGTPAPSVRFVDHALLLASAGRGGQGCRSHYRDLWMRHPRPDGGDGGDGGDVILRADPNVPTLLDVAYRKHVTAGSGGHGSSKRQRGAAGDDAVVAVPPGTLVFDAATDELLGDLARAGDAMVVARGGRGGVGNLHRREITHGEPGEERRVRLELRIVADLGIVGLPNAGKSTLLRAISAARPRVAAFPFTTLAPTLGAVSLPGSRSGDPIRCVAVDVPGLIEGASRGRGLGLAFLRHIERTRALLHVVDMAGSEGRDPVEDFRVLNAELAQYNHGVAPPPALGPTGRRSATAPPSAGMAGGGVAAKPQLIVANKMDLAGAATHLAAFRRALLHHGVTGRAVKRPIVAISAKTGEGIPALLKAAAQRLNDV